VQARWPVLTVHHNISGGKSMSEAPTEFTRVETTGRIASLIFDRPPVNAINVTVRQEILDGLAEANSDHDVDGVVLIGARNIFSAGSDIREFDTPQLSPTSVDLFRAIAASPKPVVAAIDGLAFGGGLELALACQHRIATHAARFALPEITLGLIPGGGGTQRLPRLMGFNRAIPMIFRGKPIGAEEALEGGLIDELYADLHGNAVAFVQQLIEQPPDRGRDEDSHVASAQRAPQTVDAAIDHWLSRSRSPAAAKAAAEALRTARDRPLDEGLLLERQLFMALRDGEESRAHRHVFFSERAATKHAQPKDKKYRPMSRGAVIGAGTMGIGIALAMAGAGVTVTVIDNSQGALDRAEKNISNALDRMVKSKTLDETEANNRRGRISGSLSMDAIADSDVVIEAVFEDMALKKKVLAKVDAVAQPSALLATNTSTLDVDEIARATNRPQDVVGLHFFSPAHVMPLVEIVRGARTRDDTLQRAVAFTKALGKKPVIVGVCDGFVGNRMHLRRGANVERLLQEGASPADIDRAAVSFGFAMGPCTTSDLTGLDVAWRIRCAKGIAYPVADALCELGRLGQKTGAGYYRYDEGSRTPQSDPEVAKIIANVARHLGHEPRHIPDQEILDRLLLPIINEGARVLEEKIARSPGDIDVIWANGYGWPLWRGGPMYYADQVGLSPIRDNLLRYERQLSDPTLRPANLVMRLADAGEGFQSISDDQ
jgi:3-hydroxyacyl-CoA dehydrogenase